MPMLKDVERIRGLPVLGEVVIAATSPDYRALFRELIRDWEYVERERSLNRIPLGQLLR
ncbi:hypothetical protein QJS04_geneDACA011508 [Acorus gramineus]|uniref:Uncharacterized protein n=1 Tax=Acorus gramineus TaxID=55184 RepID=A0AAV9A2V0_ACOGR|nr:hypothetical protein QJS04_geneDACA011508 [Acorus gramineus]